MLMLAASLQRPFQAAFGIDQEIAAGYNLLALGDTLFDFIITIRLRP